MNVGKAQKEFAEVVDHAACAKSRTVIRRHGKPLAAVVPIEDLRLLEIIEQEMTLREAKAAIAEANKVGAFPLAEVVARIK